LHVSRELATSTYPTESPVRVAFSPRLHIREKRRRGDVILNILLLYVRGVNYITVSLLDDYLLYSGS
jgi:hypothetical protein